MYFSKVVKKCNTGSTVYNSIDYFPNGVSVLFFLPLLRFPPPKKKKKKKEFLVCIIAKFLQSYADIHDDGLWEIWYSQK